MLSYSIQRHKQTLRHTATFFLDQTLGNDRGIFVAGLPAAANKAVVPGHIFPTEGQCILNSFLALDQITDTFIVVTAEDIFIQINYEYGSEASYYIPDDREEEELCRILTQIDKKNISKKASGGTVTPYQMMIRMPGDDGTLSREYLFHVEDNTSVSLTFDKDTADVLMKDGKYWHIKSSELVNFIKEKIEKKGHELMPAVEITRADIDHDGEEEIISVREYVSEVYRITVSEEDGTVISEMDASTGHHGWRNHFQVAV